MRLAALWLAAALPLAVSAPAKAERLLLALSADRVVIASNYTGADVVLFGAIKGAAEHESYDLVVTTRGPRETLAVREKERTLGMWLNRSSHAFRDVPLYVSVLSTQPLGEIAQMHADVREELELSAAAREGRLGQTRLPESAAALVRIQKERGLWREDGEGVSLLGEGIFRAAIKLPPNVPFGRFDVEARLFERGVEIARQTVAFSVAKAGFEDRVARLAQDQRLAFGFGSAALALVFGWAASVIFRRD